MTAAILSTGVIRAGMRSWARRDRSPAFADARYDGSLQTFNAQ